MDDRWDPRKAEVNLRKHGVGFEEALTVERDPRHLRWPDADHSMIEDRYHLLGVSDLGRILLVTGTDRRGILRPISARRATKRERYEYRSRSRQASG